MVLRADPGADFTAPQRVPAAWALGWGRMALGGSSSWPASRCTKP
jgi:hypothetical protein